MNKIIKKSAILFVVSLFGFTINTSYANTEHPLTCGQIKQVSSSFILHPSSFIQGNNQLENHQYQQSIALFDDGITLLDDGYFSLDVDDDTGIKLALAEAEQKKGNLQRAAVLKGNVLSARLDLTQEDYPDCN